MFYVEQGLKYKIYKTFSNRICGKEETPQVTLVQVALTSPVIVALWMSNPASGGQLDLHMCVIIVIRK